MTDVLTTCLQETTNLRAVAAPPLKAGGDVISKETRQLLETICYAGVTSLICVVSVPANVVNCLVFWRQGLQERMNLCLFCLALVNCLHLNIIFVVQCVSVFVQCYDKVVGEWYSSTVSVYLGGALYAFRTTSHCITMVIAVERCVCVVYPLHSSGLLRARTMGALVFVCFIVFHGCYALLTFSYRVVNITGQDKQVHVVLAPTQFFIDNEVFILTLVYTVLGIAVPIITLLTICTSTVLTVLRLKAAMTWRGKTSSSHNHSQQVALTKMLVMVSCAYIITVTPFVARQSSFWFVRGCLSSDVCYDTYFALSALVLTISYANSCVHTLIYYTHSSRFRHQLGCLLWSLRRRVLPHLK